jgi:hypothetical protein
MYQLIKAMDHMHCNGIFFFIAQRHQAGEHSGGG